MTVKPVGLFCFAMCPGTQQGEATADKSAPRQKAVLDRGRYWELRVDLDRKLVFPYIVETNLRPDAMLVSQQSKTLVAIELTVPWEENCEEVLVHKKNSLRYADLIVDCKDKGWSLWNLCEGCSHD